jgi:hypothetical protein
LKGKDAMSETIGKKRWINWSVSEDLLTLTATFDWPGVEDLVINVKDVFKSRGWDHLEDVEKKIFINGLKQRLADKGAESKDKAVTAKEKRASFAGILKMIVEERKYSNSVRGGKTSDVLKVSKAALGNKLATFSEDELNVGVKFGLYTAEQVKAEMERRKEAPVE